MDTESCLFSDRKKRPYKVIQEFGQNSKRIQIPGLIPKNAYDFKYSLVWPACYFESAVEISQP